MRPPRRNGYTYDLQALCYRPLWGDTYSIDYEFSVSVGFSLLAVIFTRNLDFFVRLILMISTSVQRINSRPDIWMYMPRTMDQKHLVTTSTTRSYERGYRGRNNESEADLPSLAIMVFLVITTADMAWWYEGKARLSDAHTCAEVS